MHLTVYYTCDHSLSLSPSLAGFTALHLAIVKSRNEVSKLLINELGVKGVGAVNESGITAAHVAASSGESSVYLHPFVVIVLMFCSQNVPPLNP